MDERIEKAIKPKEGSDPLTEDARLSAIKRARFNILTKSFQDPEGAAAHQKQLERDKLRASAEARSSTPVDNQPGSTEAAPTSQKHYALAPEAWKKPFLELRGLHVMKHPRVLQTLFYLLGYSRDQICERDTNALSFKKVKGLINEQLFTAMSTYQPIGQKTTDFNEYNKLAFLKKNLAEIEEEKVEEFSLVLRQIYRWINLAIDLRVEDVVNRRDTVEYLKQERNNQLRLNQERAALRERAYAEAKELHERRIDEELARLAEADPEDENATKTLPPRQPFDETSFQTEFDLQYPAITIPPEVEEEVDFDFDLPYTPPAASAE